MAATTFNKKNQPKKPSRKIQMATGIDTSEGNILYYPITTEKAIGMIELENKLVFVVNMGATKPQIKKEVERLFKVKVGKITTKITPKGKKQAYIKIKEGKADDIASALKIV